MTSINSILTKLVELVAQTLDQELIGIYLYGSAVHGDFDEEFSDIDLLIVTKCSVDALDFNALTKLHDKFDTFYPKWSDRIDLAYLSLGSLKSFQSKDYVALTISGAQKLSKSYSKPHWLIDWYKVLHQSKVLYGPSPDRVIPRITKKEFQITIKDYILGWKDQTKLKSDPVDLSFVVLAVCRSMYAYNTYVNVSKRQGAAWAEKEFPQFTELIRQSMLLSRRSSISGEQNLIDRNEVLRFVEYTCAKVR